MYSLGCEPKTHALLAQYFTYGAFQHIAKNWHTTAYKDMQSFFSLVDVEKNNR